MVTLLWDGTGIYKKDNQIVTAPGECCCCETGCVVPTDYEITSSGCSGIAWAQCSGTKCWDNDFSTCLSNIPGGLEEQGYHILTSGDYCCNCSGFSLQDVYACCSGYIDTNTDNDILILANVSGDCEFCYGVETITLENISGEYYWRIPKCSTELYYCILDTY